MHFEHREQEMKKIKKLIFVFSILLISILILFKNLNSIDELYSYNVGRNISNGYILYKDFNYIVFPIFPLIMGAIVKIFGQEVIIYRVFQVFIFIITELLGFRLFKLLHKENNIFRYLICIIYLSLIAIFCTLEYNFLSVMLLLIILNLEIKENKNQKDNILIGLLIGICIGNKQTVGLCIALCSIISTIFLDNTRKEKIKSIVIKLLMIISVMCCIGLYLTITSSWKEFIDYTFLGLKTFTNNKFTYFDFLIEGKFVIVLISILLICIWIFNLYKTINLKDYRITTLFIYSLSTFSIMYPITDENHILIAFYPTCILGLMLLFKDDTKLNEKLIKSFSRLLYLGIILLSIIFVCNCYRVSSYTKYKHYKYIHIEEKLENEMNNVFSFIEKHPNTYILSSSEILYMIPLNRFNGILDIPNVGNFGEKGEQVLIQYFKQLDDVYILTLPSEIMGGSNQNPKKVAEYIENNFEYIGEIEFFEIYYKP